MLGGFLKLAPWSDQRVDALCSLAFEIVAAGHFQIEIRLKRRPRGFDLLGIEHVSEDHAALIVERLENLLGGVPGRPRTRLGEAARTQFQDITAVLSISEPAYAKIEVSGKRTCARLALGSHSPR